MTDVYDRAGVPAGPDPARRPAPERWNAATEIERVDDAVVTLVEERLDVSRRRVAAGLVRVATHTETREEVAEVELDTYRIEVTRIPVDRVVEVAPGARTEGDTTIVPVLEERLVVVRQLVLKEELHIRHVIDRQLVREPVTLRRQHATVERSGGALRPSPVPGREPA